MSDHRFRLRSCVWEITLECCFSCRHCGSRAGRAREKELNTEECLDVVRQLAELGCRRVNLIGGEVFMRPDWDVIAKALNDSGVACTIITNGFYFSPHVISKLKEVGVESVAVSIDGNREIHDYLRQEGSFGRALAAIDRLREAGIPVSVITTINSMNIGCLDEMYDIFTGSGTATPGRGIFAGSGTEFPGSGDDASTSRGIFAWQLQACSPMGNAHNMGVDHDFDHKVAVDFVEKHLGEAPFMLGVADNIGYYGPSEGYIRGNLSGLAVFRGCRAGLTSIGIDSEGNVRGCESMYDEIFNEGNLRERSLRDIWEDPDGFKYNRGFNQVMLTGRCRDCEYGSVCAGGCRSFNYFTSGKLYEHPKCVRIGQQNLGEE